MTKSAVEFLVLLAHLLLLSPSSWWLTWGRGGGRVGENGDCGCRVSLRRLKPMGCGWSARWACCSRAHAGRRYLLQTQGPSGRSCCTHGQQGPPDEGGLGPGSGRPGGTDVPQLAVRRAQNTQWGPSCSSVERQWVPYIEGLAQIVHFLKSLIKF